MLLNALDNCQPLSTYPWKGKPARWGRKGEGGPARRAIRVLIAALQISRQKVSRQGLDPFEDPICIQQPRAPYPRPKMGAVRTKTVKNKHATRGSGIKNSKAASKIENDPVVKAKKNKDGRKAPVKPGQLVKELQKKRKKKVYSEKELDIPELNMVTPIGVEKPKGKKKGKVFVDDRVRDAQTIFPANKPIPAPGHTTLVADEHICYHRRA